MVNRKIGQKQRCSFVIFSTWTWSSLSGRREWREGCCKVFSFVGLFFRGERGVKKVKNSFKSPKMFFKIYGSRTLISLLLSLYFSCIYELKCLFIASIISSVTRLGDLFDFGQLFTAFGNNYFAQISHILRHFL